jgi:hypothetical protein
VHARHFALVDDVVEHFDDAVDGLGPELASRYAGLFAVSSVAVLELALKDVVIGFAKSRDVVFGDYIETRYAQTNARIKLQHIREEHLKPFGSGYVARFNEYVSRAERLSLKWYRFSLIQRYSNLITCRHKFAHEGQATCTYGDAKDGFAAGKVIISCLARSLC